MKYRFITLFLVLTSLTFNMSGCNSDAKRKEKLKSFYVTYMDWMRSGEFKSALLKNPDSEIAEEKAVEIAKSLDLNDAEITAMSEEFKNDTEIKKLNDDMIKLAGDIGTQARQELLNQGIRNLDDKTQNKIDDILKKEK